jgi:outer membrane protein W
MDGMRRHFSVLFLLLVAAPLAAQRRVDLILDVEGVRRTGSTSEFVPNSVQYLPSFSTGGGVGGGVDWFLSDRTSVEMKFAALESKLRVRVSGSDFIATADLGNAQIYPISLLVKWRMNEHAAVRPWLGVGVAHIIVRNINNRGNLGSVRFQDPTGAVVDGGIELQLSKRVSLVGDARYVPIETSSRARFSASPSDPGTSVGMHVKPLIVGFGIAYHY